MRVKVKLFAGAREAAGEEEVLAEVEEGSTVEEVAEWLRRAKPSLGPYLDLGFWARGEEYVSRQTALSEGDELALIPPVSGGGEATVGRDILSVEEEVRKVARTGAGATVVFIGTVRDVTGEERTEELEYEAYEPMARRKMEEIALETEERWPGVRVAMAHRLGRLLPGEASLVIAVSSPHREEAFLACRHALERLKREVPIWKKEHLAGGRSFWRGGEIEEPQG